ncbi:sulfotransferase family 2 domain-containing protein [Pseudorhodobacter sp.]|uniref:sulfotransferase family 2 domain-containing protein n=1 Tax=Pseudorhodobacter sp. TaxID=1934400 RepID=UPI002649EF81|nr:sulfotransferase family 2 domain-containing protein [Pseudorhodobacter sp.]MDN5788937.1 sulfotransferase family protein [Pseudorhodobacter sp.]
MIISFRRKFIFVHIPKTGGTGLALALEARATKDDILIGDTPKALARRGRIKTLPAKGRLWKHSTLADIDGLVLPEAMTEMFILTLVRNPWDRVVSLYHWLQSQSFDHPFVPLSKAQSFSDFLCHPAVSSSLRAASSASYMQDAQGKDRCSLYLRLEHLAEDITPFEQHLGFHLGPLGRVNTSNRQADWRGYYTRQTATLIADCFADDIARFGYGFDDAVKRGAG